MSMIFFMNLPCYIDADGEPVTLLPPEGFPSSIRKRTVQEFLANSYFKVRNIAAPERAIKSVQLIWAGLAQEGKMPLLEPAERDFLKSVGDLEPLVQAIYSFFTTHSKKLNTDFYNESTSKLMEDLAGAAVKLGYKSPRHRWTSNAISLGKALRRVELALFQMGINIYYEHTKLGSKVRLEWEKGQDPRNSSVDPLDPEGGGTNHPAPNSSPPSVTPKTEPSKDLAGNVTKVRDPNALHANPPENDRNEHN